MGHFYWTGPSSKQKFFSETSNLGNFSPCRVFLISVLASLLMKLNVNRRHKPAKKSIRQDSRDSQCCQWWPVHPFRELNHAQRECLKRNGEVIYRFGKHGKTGDAWKPATICSTRVGKIVTQYKRWMGGEGGSRELHRFGAGESSASAKTVTNTSFEYHLLQNEQLQIYRDQKLVETTCKSVIFFPCKTQWFQICYLVMSILKFSLPTIVWSFPNKNKSWVILSHFSHIQKKYAE